MLTVAADANQATTSLLALDPATCAILNTYVLPVGYVTGVDAEEFLADYARLGAQRNAKIVGITGSSGKTSTKDLLAAVLSPLGPVIAPPGSFNNELGHPWTALRATEDTRFLVLEMSARGRGHIATLAAIAPPKIGVVLNVGTAHLGEFGSQEVIAQTKGELVEALPDASEGGVAVLNADDLLVAQMAARTTARVVWVGSGDTAHIRAEDVRLDDEARPVLAVGEVLRRAGHEGVSPRRFRLRQHPAARTARRIPERRRLRTAPR